MLANPACRLLTLVGTGGVGKTRLAIQAAEAAQQDDFAHGVYFVPLQPVSSAEFLTSAVADALRFPLSGQEDPRVHLLNHLHDKELLLVLDNFEHLLRRPDPFEGFGASAIEEDGVDLLTDILQRAPAVQLLVTSREVLNVREEWLYPVHGLDVPPDDAGDDLGAYTAVGLFVERARRVQPDFSLDDEGLAVAEICRLVEGVPLAIELAASWTRMLACTEIAAEIRRNVDFLATSLRDVPDRHRSMRAVFDQSWQFLAAEDRSVFKRLAVFHGGFDAEAAKAVAGASLPVLAVFTDKSLLQRQPEGRYQIHELLRQYAAERLTQSSEDVAGARDLHCAHYADFLRQRFEDILGGRQRESAAEIAVELDNIRTAWRWAVEHANAKALLASAPTLAMFYQIRSRYTEGAQAFEKAAQRLAAAEPTEQVELALVTILVDQAWFYIRLGRLEEAEAVLIQCRDLYERLDIPPVPGLATDPLLGLCALAAIKGDYASALRLAQQAREASAAHNHLHNRWAAYYFAVQPALAQGEHQQAQQYAQEAYRAAQQTQDRWSMAYCLNELGDVARALGNYSEAQQHYQISYTIRKEFGDAEGMALALNRLGDVAISQANFPEAQRLYQQSRSIYADISDRGGLATSLHGLGRAAYGLQDDAAARQSFREALRTAQEVQFVPPMLSVLLDIGELLLRTGPAERGLELVALARYHPASGRETRDEAQRHLDRHATEVSPDLFAAAVQRGQENDLDVVAEAVLAELAGSDAPADVSPRDISIDIAPPAQPLIEPLTPRELEVLHLIAAGLSNREIAEELILAVGTVKRYTAEIYSKLDVHSRTQAVARARELGLLS